MAKMSEADIRFFYQSEFEPERQRRLRAYFAAAQPLQNLDANGYYRGSRNEVDVFLAAKRALQEINDRMVEDFRIRKGQQIATQRYEALQIEQRLASLPSEAEVMRRYNELRKKFGDE